MNNPARISKKKENNDMLFIMETVRVGHTLNSEEVIGNNRGNFECVNSYSSFTVLMIPHSEKCITNKL